MKLDKTMRGGFDVQRNALKDLPTLRLQAHDLIAAPLPVHVPDPAAAAPRRPAPRRLAALAAALSGLLAVLAAYLWFAPGPAAPAPLRAATRPAQPRLPAAQPPAATVPQQSDPEPAPTPLEAARAFALGDDARALERYTALARAYPEHSVYSVIAGVLARRTQER